MQNFTVEIIPDTELGGFTARVPEIPAYGEGASETEAIADLREALQAYVDVFGFEEAMSRRVDVPGLLQVEIELETPVSV
jgi:predicted RNase H-like HicB family nuclease